MCARLFDDADSQYLHTGTVIVDEPPFTMVCWVNLDDDGIIHTVMWSGDQDQSNRFHCLQVSGSGGTVRAVSVAGNTGVASSGTGWTINNWHHAGGVWPNADSRTAYLNGVAGTEDTTSTSTVVTDGFDIGRSGDSTPVQHTSGLLAELAVWNVALTAAEMAILAAGFSPLLVRPESLALYVPGVREQASGDDRDLVRGAAFASNGAAGAVSTGAHPRIIYPQAYHLGLAAAAAAPEGDPEGPLVGGKLVGRGLLGGRLAA
jgi:hypothetical protein